MFFIKTNFKKDWYKNAPTLYMYVWNENLNFELSNSFINLVQERGGWRYGNIFLGEKSN